MHRFLNLGEHEGHEGHKGRQWKKAQRGPFSPADLSHENIKAALKVHSVLGPGLLESAYEACLLTNCKKPGFKVASQVPLPVIYESIKLDIGYRLDLLVEELVIVEIKALEEMRTVHKAQLLSYLRMSKKTLGLLINFNVVHLREGLHRVVNGDDWRSPS